MSVMNDCIMWQKSLNEHGYGQDFYQGRNTKAHRAVWMKAYGPIPANMVVDHVCHNEAAKRGECAGGFSCKHRACVNLEHLRLVTVAENIRSGLHSIDTKANCPKGHSYSDPNNILVRKSGKRECAACNRVRANAAYARLKKVG